MIEIRINSEKLRRLNKIGTGTEGIIYNAGSGLLYKVYKEGFSEQLYSVDNIVRASNRQSLIKNTSLPLGPLYIDERFCGCVLKYHKHYTDIYNVNIFSRKFKMMIVRKLINYVEELTDHNIYHLDLNNKDELHLGQSNVLFSFLGSVQIIDLDGKSTVYTDNFNHNFYQLSLQSLLNLIIDLLFDFDYAGEDIMEADINYLENRLLKMGLSKEIVKMIVRQENIDYMRIGELVDESEKIRKLVL